MKTAVPSLFGARQRPFSPQINPGETKGVDNRDRIARHLRHGWARSPSRGQRRRCRVVERLARQAESSLRPIGARPLLAMARFVRGRGAVAHQR
jgi:hypothetical protein